MHIRARIAFPTILAMAVIPAAAPAVPSSQMKVPMMTVAPQIDGKVTAEEQSHTASASLQKIASLENPQFPTKVYVGATMEGLYVGFVADDPNLKGLLSATSTVNGPVFDDDSLQILLTPTLDTAADAYYHFAVNPAGVKYSSHIIEREPAEGWTAAVSKQDGENGKAGRWEAEFFIPLKAIDAPDELPVWRANFARYRPARDGQPAETSAWVDPGISLHNFKKFGYLTMPRFVPAPPGGAVNAPGNNTATATPAADSSQATPLPSAQTIPDGPITTMPISIPSSQTR